MSQVWGLEFFIAYNKDKAIKLDMTSQKQHNEQ